MSNTSEDFFVDVTDALECFNTMQSKFDVAKIDFEQTIEKSLHNVPANLDGHDLAFCLMAGIAGAVINQNDKLNEFLQKVHDDSRTDKPKTMLEKILKHTKDHMDKPGTSLPHRIAWGHDILSFGNDNPFYLMIKQKGVLRGIFQAVRHLVSDSCSEQGLPLPTSSWWDYTETDGSLGNRLIDICNKVNIEVSRSNRGIAINNQAFNQLFSIHMQDAMGKGLTFGMAKAYITMREIKDEIRQTQIHLLSTFVLFYTVFIWDAVKTGLPSINWIALGSMIKLTAQLYIKSNKKTNELHRITTEIITSNINLEKRVYYSGELLISYSDPWLYLDEYFQKQKRIDDFIDYLEEGE